MQTSSGERDLFKKCYKWKVGKEGNIMIDEEPWIDKKGSIKPIFVGENLKERYVNSLIDDNAKWREAILKENSIPLEVNEIMAMTSRGCGAKEEIIWNYGSKGVFTVKSAYHLAAELNDRAQN